jgi:hypothetical protein
MQWVMVRFQVLTVTSTNVAVFRAASPCSLVDLTDISEEFTASFMRFILIALMVEARRTSETSVNV